VERLIPSIFRGADFVAIGAGEDAGDVVEDGAVEVGIIDEGVEGAGAASGTGHCRRGMSMGRIPLTGAFESGGNDDDSSSRTFPGQVWAVRRARAPGAKPRIGLSCCWLQARRNRPASRGMSSLRSRSGGMEKRMAVR